MKRSTIRSTIATLILFAALPSQATLIIEQVNGQWLNSTGGVPSFVEFYPATSAYGNTLQQRIDWGDPASQGGKSGLGFTGAAPSGVPVVDTVPFQIGEIVHFNRLLVWGTASTAVEMALSITFADGPTAAMILELGLNETDNFAGQPRQSDDVVTLHKADPATVEIAGTWYTFQVAGFGTNINNLTDIIRTAERRQSTTYVWGTMTEIPEPASCVIVGIGGLSLLRRRRS